MSDKICNIAGYVFSTTDYSRFKMLEGNRDVVESRKQKILNSIREVGYVRNPIVINKNYEIIDGQGRFEALKELGLPIEYVTSKDAGLEECVALNLGQTNWKSIDYIKSYATRGNENYTRFLGCLNEHKWISVQELYGIVSNKIVGYGGLAQSVNQGKLVFTEKRRWQIEKSLAFLMGVKDELKMIKGSRRVLITSIAWVINNTKCDTKRLRKIVQEKYPIINPVVTADHFLDDLSNIYNKGIKSDKCIYFDTEYKKFVKGVK